MGIIQTSQNPGLAASFLSVSRDCLRLAAPNLYNRPFLFHISAEKVKAFLDTRKANALYRFKRMGVHYFLPSPNATLYTNDKDWRHLLSCVRHEHQYIEWFGLRINDAFWSAVRWELGVEYVFGQENINARSPVCHEEDESFQNFLFHVAKLAGKQVKLSLLIDGADSDDKKEFVQALQSHIQAKMKKRPLLTS